MKILTRVLRKVGTGLLGSVLVLLLVEAALWPFYGSPPPQGGVAAGLGGRGHYLDVEPERVVLTHRSPGDHDTFPLKPTGRRVVFLGGSSVLQGRPAWSDLFATRVGTMAGVESVNLGGPGLESADLVTITRELEAVPLDVPDSALFIDQVHFNERGHQEMAALLAPAVQAALERP